MKPAEVVALLEAFYRDRLALLLRHQDGARQVIRYDFNNTYQYILAREEMHLSWLADAIAELGGSAPPDEVDFPAPPTGQGEEGMRAVIADDARLAERFVAGWRNRVETVTDARHGGMLRVILGETLEHKRFFEQALAGRTDLLGRHANGAGSRGAVLPTRWIE